MAYLKIPFFGWIGHWHVILTAAFALAFYSLEFFSPSDVLQALAALAVGFILAIAFFNALKGVFVRKVIAFDMGGVFATGAFKFERLKPVPETIEFIKRLRANYNTALVSNQPPDAYDNLRRKFNLDGMFDYQVISFHARAEKPDPKFYQLLLTKTGRKASDVIFIDDDETNVMAARKLGLKGIVFKSLPQLKEALQANGISV